MGMGDEDAMDEERDAEAEVGVVKDAACEVKDLVGEVKDVAGEVKDVTDGVKDVAGEDVV
jgi:hypothetical protein